MLSSHSSLDSKVSFSEIAFSHSICGLTHVYMLLLLWCLKLKPTIKMFVPSAVLFRDVIIYLKILMYYLATNTTLEFCLLYVAEIYIPLLTKLEISSIMLALCFMLSNPYYA